MEKTITITEKEYQMLRLKILKLEDMLHIKTVREEAHPMPDEIVAYEYLVQSGRKRHWKYGDEGYGGSCSPKGWRDLPGGHNLTMIRQAVYRRDK